MNLWNQICEILCETVREFQHWCIMLQCRGESLMCDCVCAGVLLHHGCFGVVCNSNIHMAYQFPGSGWVQYYIYCHTMQHQKYMYNNFILELTIIFWWDYDTGGYLSESFTKCFIPNKEHMFWVI